MPRPEKKHKISVTMIKKEVAFEDVVDDVRVRTQAIQVPGAQHAMLYFRATEPQPPTWVPFFEGQVNAQRLELLNASTSALLLVKSGGRTYALAFGYGRHLISPSAIESSFGLIVTLNSIDPDKIRTIDRDSLDVFGRRTHEQASREASMGAFGLNVDEDLLRAVTGVPRDELLGERISGADALALFLPVGVSGISALLADLQRRYEDKTYKRDFPWIDNIRAIKDPVLVENLEDILINRLRAKELERIWLAVPEAVDWAQVRGFRFEGLRDKVDRADIYLPAFLDKCRSPESINVSDLKRWRVVAYSITTDASLHTWDVFRCIYAEIEHDGHVYVLNAGKWYDVEGGFVRSVNKGVRPLLEARAGGIVLPPYSDPSEQEYNKRVCKESSGNFSLMDGKLVQYGGRYSKVEVCDMIGSTGQFVHVKRYSGSGVLSHLFAQGVVPAEAYVNDPEFRKKVNQMLPKCRRLRNPLTRIDPSNYSVLYAIISRSGRALQLPFFSRVSLRNAHRRLAAIGYNVEVVKVSMN